MAEIIRKRKQVEVVTHNLSFTWKKNPHAGFGFPCNEQGLVDTSTLSPAGLENYLGCVTGEFDVEPQGVETQRYHYWEPAVLRCDCGRELTLANAPYNNTCACGQEYNCYGQALAPRSQWGWDTGETLADILNPYDPEDLGGY